MRLSTPEGVKAVSYTLISFFWLLRRCGGKQIAARYPAYSRASMPCTSAWDRPNCGAICDVLTPAMRAARTAFTFDGVMETGADVKREGALIVTQSSVCEK